MEALGIRFRTAYFLHLLLDKGKARVKGKGSDPNNHIITGEGRRPTPISKIGHLTKLKSDFPGSRPETMGAEFI